MEPSKLFLKKVAFAQSRGEDDIKTNLSITAFLMKHYEYVASIAPHIIIAQQVPALANPNILAPFCRKVAKYDGKGTDIANVDVSLTWTEKNSGALSFFDLPAIS